MTERIRMEEEEECLHLGAEGGGTGKEQLSQRRPHTVGKGRCGRKHQYHWEAGAVRGVLDFPWEGPQSGKTGKEIQ